MLGAMEIGITLDGTDLVARARFAEQLGFESVWLPDLQFGDGTPGVEAVTALAVVAGATERVRIGFATLVLPLRPVAWLATQISTLQRLSGDRLLLGVGLGGFPTAPFWRAAGAQVRGRGARADDVLRALPALLAGRAVSVNATPLRVPPATMPPVLVGGNSAAAVDRAVRLGDEWFPSLIGPSEVAARRPSGMRVTVGGHLFVSGSPDAFVRGLVVDHGMSEVDAAGAAITLDRLAAYEEAGVHRMVLSVDADGSQWYSDVTTLAGELSTAG
jgi:alkanesulfonate monooxygenase SsuD/methylene tetrahydromethanopterin reductase-like flavin-dependent oxidoreductase (luciferase family)